MPSVPLKQKRFFQAVAHNPQFAAKVGVPQSVGEDFSVADEAQGTLGKLMSPKRRKKRILGPLPNGPT